MYVTRQEWLQQQLIKAPKASEDKQKRIVWLLNQSTAQVPKQQPSRQEKDMYPRSSV
jgi:hypothetical protein